jgi:hypothetical protein
MAIKPGLPPVPVAAPDTIKICPVLPLLDVPDSKDKAPLTPDIPPFLLLMYIAPLEELVPTPLTTFT